MAPVFGPLAEDGYSNLKQWSDEEIETVLRFLKVNREFLARHATRVQRLIAERGEADQPSVTSTSLSTADSAPQSSPGRPRS